jgi:polyhydroxybutyrate depolymerase
MRAVSSRLLEQRRDSIAGTADDGGVSLDHNRALDQAGMFDQEVDDDVGISQGGFIKTVPADNGVFEELVAANKVGRIILELRHQCGKGLSIRLLFHVKHRVVRDTSLLQHILRCDRRASIRVVEERHISHRTIVAPTRRRVCPLRYRWITAIAVVFALAGCTGLSTAGQGEDLEPGDHEVPVSHLGSDRQYLVHVPESQPEEPLAVVMLLHGGGSSADEFRDLIAIETEADRYGFVVVYPDGTGSASDRQRTWNTGPDCCGQASSSDVDDVGFLRQVLVDVSQRVNVNPDRVYVGGFSDGAMMTYRFASEASELLAAAVVVGGPAPSGSAPSTPVPLLHVHSVDDPLATYEGGIGSPLVGPGPASSLPSVVEGIEGWAAANGCTTASLVAGPLTGEGVHEGQSAVLVHWTGCAAPVHHLRLTGIGHYWPGAIGEASPAAGPPTRLVSANRDLLGFVSRFRRGSP